jgi:nucleoside-diphosphate-sugar epimerase
LYGGTRKIGAFLAGKKELSGGESPVNLIHQDDAVGILQKIIEQREKVGGEIFNGCCDVHPTKKVLYTAAAKKMDLAVPQFIEEKNSVKKIVVNEKVKKVLGYEFLHPDPLKNI